MTSGSRRAHLYTHPVRRVGTECRCRSSLEAANRQSVAVTGPRRVRWREGGAEGGCRSMGRCLGEGGEGGCRSTARCRPEHGCLQERRQQQEQQHYHRHQQQLQQLQQRRRERRHGPFPGRGRKHEIAPSVGYSVIDREAVVVTVPVAVTVRVGGISMQRRSTTDRRLGRTGTPPPKRGLRSPRTPHRGSWLPHPPHTHRAPPLPLLPHPERKAVNPTPTEPPPLPLLPNPERKAGFTHDAAAAAGVEGCAGRGRRRRGEAAGCAGYRAEGLWDLPPPPRGVVGGQ